MPDETTQDSGRTMRLLSLFDVDDGKNLDSKEKSKQMKLREAAMKGTLPLLTEILEEDPFILTSTAVSSMPNAPLHIAVLLGHANFTKDLLSRRPELATALNSRGSSALHLAAAKGYEEIVKELLLVNPDMCLVLDGDGRSPLHLAAIKGRVRVLAELIRVKPEATRVLTSEGETCLHLCVKYSRLEALKALLRSIEKDDQQFVNWKDKNGNTILHLAVAKKQIEIINYLIASTAIELHTQNANGHTAMNMLIQSPRDMRDIEIKQCLSQGRGSKIKRAPTVLPETNGARTVSLSDHQDSTTKNNEENHPRRQTDWLGRKRSTLMIVASLLATVAFQAGLSPPGGVWQADSDAGHRGKPYQAGQSIMAYNIPRGYGQFVIFNTISFLASLSIILIQISGLPLRKRRWMWTQMVIMCIAISAQTITYLLTLIHMSPKQVTGTLSQVTRISVLVWLCLMGTIFIGNVGRIIRHMLRKYGYIVDKKEEPLNNEEDDDA